MKERLLRAASQQLKGVASPFLLKRALSVIEESAEDKESLAGACVKVSKIVALFIDVLLAERISRDLLAALNEIGEEGLKQRSPAPIEKCLS